MKYSKDSSKTCVGNEFLIPANSSLTNSSSVLKEAKESCTNNDDCSTIYDSGCDDFGPFQLCDKYSVLENSPSSCIYTKKGNSYISD